MTRFGPDSYPRADRRLGFRPAALLLVAAAAAAWFPALGAVPGVAITKQVQVHLELRPLPPATIAGPARPLTLDLAPGERASGALSVVGPAGGDPIDLRLTAERLAPDVDGRSRVALRAESRAAGEGEPTVAQRSMAFEDHDTVLFEVRRDHDLPLTLAVVATTSLETVVRKAPSVGRAVRLNLEIQRVSGGDSVTVETNRLDTFVQQAVSYSFRIGGQDGPEGLDLSLRPLALHGDVLELEVQVSGTLPAGDELVVVGRTEHWVASRGATSTLSVVQGTPGSGYRFLVTPSF